MPKEYRTIQEIAGPLMLVRACGTVRIMNWAKSS